MKKKGSYVVFIDFYMSRQGYHKSNVLKGHGNLRSQIRNWLNKLEVLLLDGINTRKYLTWNTDFQVTMVYKP